MQKELLFSSDEGWNGNTGDLVFKKPWTEYSQLIIVGTFSGTNEWTEHCVQKETLQHLKELDNHYLMLSGYSNYYMNLKVIDEITIRLYGAISDAMRIYYVYGIK